MTEESTPSETPAAPNIGVLRLKYGKDKFHRACCKSCEPEWRGKPSNKQDAFQEAIIHAMEIHHWMPNAPV